MKKFLAILLSAVLMLTATLAATPLSAFADEKIATQLAVTPFPEYTDTHTIWNLGNYTVATDVQPLSIVARNGRYRKLLRNASFSASGGIMASAIGERNALSAKYSISSDETHFMFYFKTDGPITFYPRYYADISSSVGYKNLTLKNGATVQILKDGTDSWQDVKTVESGDSGTTFGNAAIVLTKKFSGYIKIAYEDIGNDTDGAMKTSNGIATGACFRNTDIFFKAMGGDYATEYTVGPYFGIQTANPDPYATQIVVDEQYAPADVAATPLTISSQANSISGLQYADAWPLDYTSTAGKQFLAKTAFYSVEDNGRGTNGIVFNLDNVQTNTTDRYFMMYIKTNGAFTFTPRLYVDGAAAGNSYYLAYGTAVQILKDGSSNWEVARRTNTVNSSIVLESAFSGYVKIEYGNFVKQDDMVTRLNITDNTHNIPKVEIYMYGMGLKDTNPAQATDITVGPFFNVTSNSGSDKISVSEQYQPQPIVATPIGITGTDGSSADIKTNVTFTDAKQGSVTRVLGKTGTLNTGKDFYSIRTDDKRGTLGIAYSMSDTEVVDTASEKFFMFRLDTDGPVSVSPQIRTVSGGSYYFKKTATVYALQDNSTLWENKRTVNGDSVGGWSQIEFNKAFHGYVKIAYSDLDMTNVSGALNYTILYIAGMGEKNEYSNAKTVTVGPIFTVTSDSNSNIIKVPTGYEPIPPQPVQATPLQFHYNANWTDAIAQVTVSTPLTFSGAEGRTLTSKNGQEFTAENGVITENKKAVFEFIDKTVSSNETHFMFYLETKGKLTFTPTLLSSGNYTYYLKNGSVVQILKDGSDEWEDLNTVANTSDSEKTQIGSKNTYDGSLIKLTEGFKGFIKISYQDIGSNDTNLGYINSNASKTYPLTNMSLYLNGMGGDCATEVTVGPFYTVTADSELTDIDINTVDNDANTDGAFNAKDLAWVRNVINGAVSNLIYTLQYGDLKDDDIIDICDLVKLTLALQPAE